MWQTGCPISRSCLDKKKKKKKKKQRAQSPRRGRGVAGEKEKEAATCLSILQSKPIPQRRSWREHHYDNPRTPKNQDFKGGDGVPLRECETTSCSHLHLIRTLLPFNSKGVYTHTHTHSIMCTSMKRSNQTRHPRPVLLHKPDTTH